MEERIREMVTCTEFEYLARLNGKKLYSSENIASTGFLKNPNRDGAPSFETKQ
jgi:hypothetical protein